MNIEKPSRKVSIGDVFGLLTVKALSKQKPPGRKLTAICSCECGNTKEIIIYHLLDGRAKSCGCRNGFWGGNEIKIKVDHAEVMIKDSIVYIDLDDVKKVKSSSWSLEGKTTQYARAYIHGKHVLMHRLILDFPDSRIDHKDGNSLNNRKSNLRLATHAQNTQNAVSNIGTSKYKGVYRKGGKWAANCQQKHLGTFDTEEMAALAYDAAAKMLFGEFARLNFEEAFNESS